MKQPQIRLKEKDGEDLGVFPVFIVEWMMCGDPFMIEVKFLTNKKTQMYVSGDNKTFVNVYGNIIGTLIDEESPE